MKIKVKFYDWLWWTIGLKLWRKSARNHSQFEVDRRLNWMKLDNNGKEIENGLTNNEKTILKKLEDDLYNHESPYYYKAARGMVKEDFSDEWYAKREELTKKIDFYQSNNHE